MKIITPKKIYKFNHTLTATFTLRKKSGCENILRRLKPATKLIQITANYFSGVISQEDKRAVSNNNLISLS